MQQLTIKQVDAFTAEPFHGNPAGVITNASSLTLELMQTIAAEMSLSETAFVSPPSSSEATFRIRFFTPSNEVDMSGHVLIAATYALIEDEQIELFDGITKVIFETRAGNLPVDIHFRLEGSDQPHDAVINGGMPLELAGGRSGRLEKIVINQKIHDYRLSTIPVDEIASILGIQANEITMTGLPIEIISTGLDQLMVPIVSKELILDMHPDMIKLSLLNKKFGIDTNHIFTLDTFGGESTSYSRHFAPKLGMWEDMATGTAAAGLGLYLKRHGAITGDTMLMEQGHEKDALATILVHIDESDGVQGIAQIGGLAVTSITRTLEIGSGEVKIY
jgi:trans-2,3-dihydro-3-hydroxyanthranilate isomerase